MSKDYSPKVLIIEDDPVILKIIQSHLTREMDFDILVAVDQEEGLQKIKSEKPDVVLLDILLGGQKSGLDILTEIKANPQTSKIPVIILSNLGQDEMVEKALKLGADKFVVKGSISIPEFIEKIRNCLKSPSSTAIS